MLDPELTTMIEAGEKAQQRLLEEVQRLLPTLSPDIADMLAYSAGAQFASRYGVHWRETLCDAISAYADGAGMGRV